LFPVLHLEPFLSLLTELQSSASIKDNKKKRKHAAAGLRWHDTPNNAPKSRPTMQHHRHARLLSMLEKISDGSSNSEWSTLKPLFS